MLRLSLKSVGSRGIIAESHVALARLLLARGADVNHSDQHGYTPLHYAAHGRNYGRARESSHSESGPEVPLAALLINAGANVLALNYRNHNPLSLVYQRMRQAGPSRSGMEMALLLLRALPSLDYKCLEKPGNWNYPFLRTASG